MSDEKEVSHGYEEVEEKEDVEVTLPARALAPVGFLKSDRCPSQSTKPTQAPNTGSRWRGYFDIFFFFDFFVAMAHFLLD